MGACLCTCFASIPWIRGHQGKFATAAHSLELPAGLVPLHAENKALIHCVGVFNTLGMASQPRGFLLCSLGAGGWGVGCVWFHLESLPISPGFAMGKGVADALEASGHSQSKRSTGKVSFSLHLALFSQMKLVLACSQCVLGTSWAVGIFWAQAAEVLSRTSPHKAVCRTGSLTWHLHPTGAGSQIPGAWRLELGFARLQFPAPRG